MMMTMMGFDLTDTSRLWTDSLFNQTVGFLCLIIIIENENTR